MTDEGHRDVQLDRRVDATHLQHTYNTPAAHLQHTCSTPATHCNTLEQTTYETHRDVRLDRRADATRLQQTCNTLHHATTLQARVCMGVYTSVCSREGGVYTLYVSR